MCEQDFSPSAELISLILLVGREVQLIRNRTLISLVNCGRANTEIVPGLPRSLINRFDKRLVCVNNWKLCEAESLQIMTWF
jgi:hypothetical protein